MVFLKLIIQIILFTFLFISCRQELSNDYSNFTGFLTSSKQDYNTNKAIIKLNFNAPITELKSDAIVILRGNASISNMTKIDDRNYQFELNLISEGVIRIYMRAEAAVNTFGDLSRRSKTLDIKFDNSRPSSTLTSNLTIYNKKEMSFELVFSEDVSELKPENIVYTNSTVTSVVKKNTKEYTINLLAVNEGAVSIQIPENIVSDDFGNKNTASNRVDTEYCLNCLVLGQADFNKVDYKKDLLRALNSPKASFVSNDKLFVADSHNNRILIWNSIPTTSLYSPSLVLGQADFKSSTVNQGKIASNIGLSDPQGIFYDGQKLYVADTGNSRILIWNTLPTANNTPADIVIGQADFQTHDQTVSSRLLNKPTSVFVVNNKMVVADTGNNRVLIWNSIPTSNYQNASIVLGQSNFTSKTHNSGGISASTMYSPTGITSDGTQLMVADSKNNRVLIWTTFPVAHSQASDLVLGQNIFTSNNENNGGLSSSSLKEPYSLHIIGNRFFVGDSGNHRILVWNTIPSSNFATASYVLGQTDFISDSYTPETLGPRTYSTKSQFSGNSSYFFVPDTEGHRMLGWNSLPNTTNYPALTYFGQYSFVANRANLNVVSNQLFHNPGKVHYDGSRLYLVESDNNRVLVWNSLPTSVNQAPDIVIGQPDFNSYAANNTGIDNRTLKNPQGIYTDGTKLYIADSGNNRVLIWNSVPNENFKGADLVLGQLNFYSNDVNYNGLSASSLSFPTAITRIYDKLIVLDTNNNRALVYNYLPVNHNQPANYVIGQSSMTRNGVNDGGIDPGSLNLPRGGLVTDGVKLLIGDTGNHRVLIFNTLPVNNNENAHYVIGQANFTDSLYRSDGYSNKTLGKFTDMHLTSDKKLIISDGVRILQWNTIPQGNFIAANTIYGPTDFNFTQENIGGLSYQSFAGNNYTSTTNNYLIVSDPKNSRIIFIRRK